MRHSHRDPRSLMELRRLALRARRYPEQTFVLHDALLETFPYEYESRIDFAELLSRKEHVPYIILFDPKALSRAGRTETRTASGRTLFAVYGNPVRRPEDRDDYRRHPWAPEFVRRIREQDQGRLSDAVLVYISGLKRKRA